MDQRFVSEGWTPIFQICILGSHKLAKSQLMANSEEIEIGDEGILSVINLLFVSCTIRLQ